MNHKMHLYLTGGLVIVGAVWLLFGGGTAFGGGGLSVLVLLGFCFAMMFFMMRGMGGGSGPGGMGGMNGMGGGSRGGPPGADRPTEFDDDAQRRK